MKENTYPSSSFFCSYWDLFASRVRTFLDKTCEHILQGLNPGGIYQAIWYRDASYILKDWFLSGNVDGVMQQIYHIWHHQITPTGAEKLIYGRGSPEMNFEAKEVNSELRNKFEGALPTTTYPAGFSEIYGQNPDIDSTSLMISTTSWILARLLMIINNGQSKQQKPPEVYLYKDSVMSQSSSVISSELLPDHYASPSYFTSKVDIQDPSKVTEFVVPLMLKAIDYLKGRDVDNDGLLEQNHNEDWMDTALRTGKIVYSQACWLLALNDFSSLLARLGKDKEATKLIQLADRTLYSVEKKLWSKEEGCYIDLQESETKEGLLTQDISLYLIAISQNTANDSLRINQQDHDNDPNQGVKAIRFHNRAIRTLDAIRKRIWNERFPLATERQLKKTGPLILKPYTYHNHTFWPWTTGIEMLARSRFNKIHECDILLSKLACNDGEPLIRSFYEWINPITSEGDGAYPFRTGISAVRIALTDIAEKIKIYISNSTNTNT